MTNDIRNNQVARAVQQHPRAGHQKEPLMPQINVPPTARPPRQRPATITVPLADIARYGPAVALVLTALGQAAEPTPTTALAERTGLDPGALSGAILDLHRLALIHSCKGGWWLNDELAAARTLPETGR